MPPGARSPNAKKKLRGKLNAARRWSFWAGIYAGAAGVLIPYAGLGPPDAVWGALAGGTILGAMVRWGDYRRMAKALPAERDQIALHGSATLSAEIQALSSTAATAVRRRRTRARFRKSAAYGGYVRLDAAAEVFDGLNKRMDGAAREAVGDVTDTSQALYELAERILEVERSAAIGSATNRAQSAATLQTLVDRLENGVSAYEDMVAAAGQCVAEQDHLNNMAHDDTDATYDKLLDATARLRGVADTIGEMRDPNRGTSLGT